MSPPARPPLGNRPATGTMRLAQVTFGSGIFGALSVLVIVSTANRPGTYEICQYSLLAFWIAALLTFPTIVLGLVAFWRISRRGDRGKSLAILSLVGCLVVVAFASRVLTPDVMPCGPHPASSVGMAVRSLRAINDAELTYASTYTLDYSPSLQVLGPAAAGVEPSASAASLIDDVLARGEKSGYIYTYAPGERGSEGHITSYTLTARPRVHWKRGEWSSWSLFTDQSGIIRYTAEEHPATAKDLALDPNVVASWR